MSTKAYDTVKLARANKRPTGLDYIHNLCGDFFELHGDRCYADDGAIVGGIGHFRGIPVTMIAIEKGHSAKERTARSFGAPHPEGYRKALRLMRQAEKFHRPVLCLVDTSGAFCGVGAEERGQGEAIAENMYELMTVKTPVISVVIGEGGSGGALALAVADEVWMLEDAYYSVISPEGAASILWKDAKRAKEAAESLRLTAQDLYGFGVIEKIVAAADTREAGMPRLKQALSEAFSRRAALDTAALLKQRYRKFRGIGGGEA